MSTRPPAKESSGAALRHSEIKELIELVSARGIDEFSLDSGDVSLRIVVRRAPQQTVLAATPAVHAAAHIPAPPAPAAASPASAPETTSADPAASRPTADNPKYKKITAPMVGTFYRSPAPDSAPFVQTGDKVDENTVLCIIEAMKLLNEIKSEMRGVVRGVLVENGQPVEYGQPIYLIEPA